MTRTITALHTLQDGHRLIKPLVVRHVRGGNDKPLCIVHNLPGLDAELHPDRLEALGRQLIYAAHDARLGAQGERQYPDDAAPVRHEMTPGYLEYPDPPIFDESASFDPIGIDSEGGSHD